MKIKCPNCNIILDIPDIYLGKNIKCPECNKSFEASGDVIVKDVIVRTLEAIPESAGYKTVSDFPEKNLVDILQFLGILFIIIGVACLIFGIVCINSSYEKDKFFGGVLIYSGLGTILSSVWFYVAQGIINAINRNTLEVHLLRKQQNKVGGKTVETELQ
jgi:hypothetical protein